MSTPTRSTLDEREWRRQQALARYAVLDTLPEAAFDRITALAARLFDARIALIAFADDERLWLKACTGLEQQEARRSESFCAHTLDLEDVLVVPDVGADPRFASLPIVTGPLGIRFYAGAPLRSPEGLGIGTLCVLGDHPRPDLSADERATLRDLAALVMDELELRLASQTLLTQTQANESLVRALQESNRVSATLIGVQQLMQLRLSPPEAARHAMTLLGEAAEVDWCSLLSVGTGPVTVEANWLRPGQSVRELDLPTVLPRGSGLTWQALERGRPLYVNDYPAHPQAAPGLVALGMGAGAWLPLGEYRGQRYLMVAVRRERGAWQEHERALLDAGAVCIQRALEEREHERERERELLSDPLTGLGNRRALTVALDNMQSAALLAVVDLDGFKAVNDRLGHARGDALLRLFADALLLSLPPCAQAFRTGGDEFVLLAEATHGERTFLNALDSALTTLRAAEYPVGAAIGVAAWPADAPTLTTTLEVADARMYVQKRARRQVQVEPTPAPTPDQVQFAGLRVSLEHHHMQLGEVQVALRPREAALMAVLAARPERFHGAAELALAAWGPEANPGNVLEVHISSLRRKLARLGRSLTIRNRRGAGYALHLPSKV